MLACGGELTDRNSNILCSNSTGFLCYKMQTRTNFMSFFMNMCQNFS